MFSSDERGSGDVVIMITNGHVMMAVFVSVMQHMSETSIVTHLCCVMFCEILLIVSLHCSALNSCICSD